MREQMLSAVSQLVLILLALNSSVYCLSMSTLASPAAARNKEPIWKVNFDELKNSWVFHSFLLT